jgi:hypothetical protein
MTAPDTFRKNGFQYNLILSNSFACIYEQLYSQKTQDTPLPISYFEVISLINEKGEERVNKGGERFGKIYEDSFPIPGNEDFGTWAWSFRSYDKALLKFNSLENENI